MRGPTPTPSCSTSSASGRCAPSPSPTSTAPAPDPTPGRSRRPSPRNPSTTREHPVHRRALRRSRESALEPKRHPGGAAPALADVYGSTWITAGAGSVILLAGEAGDPIVDMRHLKQPAGEVGPYRLLHDQDTGAMTVEHSTDLLAIAAASGGDGLTAKRAAVAVFEKDTPTRAQIEKVRRKLDRLVRSGLLVREDGQVGPEGGTPPALWHPVEGSHESSHAGAFCPSSHGLTKQ